MMSSLLRDLRYAARSLWKSPMFATVAVASLALGIGVNTAVFNLVSAVLLRPLPVPNPEQLVSMYTLDRKSPGFLSCSYPNYKDYRDHNTVFSGLLLFSSLPVNLTGKDEPEELPAQIVSGNYFDVLGVKPILGRAFVPQENQVPGAQAVVVIGYAFWTHRFAASRQAIGTTINLNNHPYTIVGVAPKDFHGTNALVNPDFWLPMMMYQQVFPMADWFDRRRALLFSPIGRLKEGVSRRQAEANMKALAAQLEQAYPKDNQGRTVVLIPLAQALINPNARGAYVLGGGLALGASGLVLLIACANVGNLLLVRAAGRRKEMALRLALGVSRGRLIAQFLTESTLLSMIGGVVALALARWARDLLWTARPPSMLSGDAGLSFDSRVLGFTLLLSVLSGAVFGLAPALRVTRTDLATELRERRSPWTSGGHRVSLRSVLVMVQVALSVVALTGAGLLMRSLHFAQGINPGFDSAHLATLSLDSKARGSSEAAGHEFYRQVLERVRGLPGVEAASLAGIAPFGIARARSISVEGQDAAGPGILALIDSVEPGYFQTVRIPVLRGRTFTDEDASGAPRVSVVNETMARRFWSGKDPIGARLRLFGESAPVEIVGVVRDSTYMSMGEPPRLMVYLCLRQNYSPTVTLCVRTSGDPQNMLGPVRREIQRLAPGILVSDLQTMPQIIHESLWAPRLGAILFAAFGALAGLLTVVGIYGVISYSVGQRTREMGIRMALGAQAGNVLRQVLAEGMILVAWGIVLGLCATVTISGVLSTMLFGVSTRDPLTLAVVILILLSTAWAACYVPALRATRVDPMMALRDE
ncbi:MAG: ABC transporter permease [Bryobacteraceae bacterium]